MAYYPESKAPTSALAITSLVLAGSSVLLVFIGPLLAIPAIILGIAAFPALRRQPPLRRGRGLAISGIVIGAIGLLLSIALFVFAPTLFGNESPTVFLRDVANRSGDLRCVRLMIADARAYANENQGSFPPHLAAIAAKMPTPRVFVSRTSKKTPPTTAIPDTPWQELAPDIDAHCDYTYIGADINLPTLLDPSQVVVLYSNDIYPDHGRLVGFADGHVIWTTENDLPSVFDQSNHQRVGSSLPAVALDGPPPKPITKTGGIRGKSATQTANLPQLPPEIKTPADALQALRSDSLDRRLAAVVFLESAPADAAVRSQISRQLEAAVPEPELRFHALSALKTWATRDNVPGLIARLKAIKPDETAEANAILEALGGTGDAADTADLLAKYLIVELSRHSAATALLALGPSAEPAVLFYLNSKDLSTATEACQVLAQIGTARSLPALHDVSPKNIPLRREADAAIQAIQSRTPSSNAP